VLAAGFKAPKAFRADGLEGAPPKKKVFEKERTGQADIRKSSTRQD